MRQVLLGHPQAARLAKTSPEWVRWEHALKSIWHLSRLLYLTNACLLLHHRLVELPGASPWL